MSDMSDMTDIVTVGLSGKKINEYIYTKSYLYSLTTEKLLEQKRTEKSVSGNDWRDLYFLPPGKYLIVEVNEDGTKINYNYKCLTVFTKEEFLSEKRKQFSNDDANKFKKVYPYAGSEIVEWKEDIPSWVELSFEGIETNEVRKKEEYKQPQEVEDKLSFLLKEDEEKKSIVQYLIKKNKKI